VRSSSQPIVRPKEPGVAPPATFVRKRSAVTGTLVGVRLQADQIKAIDAWAVKQNPPVTRPEAMLQILSKDRERSHPRRRRGNEMMATDQPDSPLAGLS